ncbi:MAG TPA: YlbF family regulator [Symbiobacteriaceae bacterium]|nr:YlbF family regulator [Symbiobacteriaceae bacterium]
MLVETKKSVWELARELAKSIEESDELIAYRTTEDAVLADQEALDLIRDYETAKRAVKKSKALPQEQQVALVTRFMQIEERFDSHPTIQAYWNARTSLDAFMDRINAVVTFPITGEEAPKVKGGACSTGGSCSTGGGCGCS